LKSFVNLTNETKLYVKITDDFGIDLNLTKIKIGGGAEKDFEKKLDYFIIDLNSETIGTKNLTIETYDLSGNNKNFSKQINIVENSNPTIKNIYLREGVNFGKDIFIKKTETIILNPSTDILINKITLDGMDQIDYNILEDKTIKVNLKIKNKQGNLKIDFYNYTGGRQINNYTYYLEEENPKIEIDFITNLNSQNNNTYIKLIGKINSNQILLDNLKVGKDSFIFHYSNNFEIYTKSTKPNLQYETIFENSKNKDLIGIEKNNEKNSSLTDSTNRNTLKLGSTKRNIKLLENNGFLINSNLYLGSVDLPISQLNGYQNFRTSFVDSNNQFNEIENIVNLTSFKINDIIQKEEKGENGIYLTGNNFETNKNEITIFGIFKSKNRIISISSNHKNCDFENEFKTFYCKITNPESKNYKILINGIISKNFTIQKIESTQNLINITNLEGLPKSYSLDGIFYTTSQNLSIQLKPNKDSIGKLIISGSEKEIEISNKTISADISNLVKNQNTANIEISIYDKNDNTISNKLIYYYKRFFETISRVTIN
jgi:hypothetical protein